MISRIAGRLIERREDSIILNVGGISYEILIPGAVMSSLDSQLQENNEISLITYHYLQVEPSRSFPFLIGFLNEVEKEFFGKFITVSGIGPKAAVRALKVPISAIARAIDIGDIPFLKSLPGIGEQRAREIVAKLQGKVGKFGLIRDKGGPVSVLRKGKEEDIGQEAMDVLLQLQYKKSEANNMIQGALNRNSNIKTAEDLLNEVYKQKTKR